MNVQLKMVPPCHPISTNVRPNTASNLHIMTRAISRNIDSIRCVLS